MFSVRPSILLPGLMHVCIIHDASAISVARFDGAGSEAQVHRIAAELVAGTKQVDADVHY